MCGKQSHPRHPAVYASVQQSASSCPQQIAIKLVNCGIQFFRSHSRAKSRSLRDQFKCLTGRLGIAQITWVGKAFRPHGLTRSPVCKRPPHGPGRSRRETRASRPHRPVCPRSRPVLSLQKNSLSQVQATQRLATRLRQWPKNSC
jgi:hypothetical protein